MNFDTILAVESKHLELSIESKPDRVLIPLYVNGNKINLLFDTGSSNLVLNNNKSHKKCTMNLQGAKNGPGAPDCPTTNITTCNKEEYLFNIISNNSCQFGNSYGQCTSISLLPAKTTVGTKKENQILYKVGVVNSGSRSSAMPNLVGFAYDGGVQTCSKYACKNLTSKAKSCSIKSCPYNSGEQKTFLTAFTEQNNLAKKFTTRFCFSGSDKLFIGEPPHQKENYNFTKVDAAYGCNWLHAIYPIKIAEQSSKKHITWSNKSCNSSNKIPATIVDSGSPASIVPKDVFQFVMQQITSDYQNCPDSNIDLDDCLDIANDNNQLRNFLCGQTCNISKSNLNDFYGQFPSFIILLPRIDGGHFNAELTPSMYISWNKNNQQASFNIISGNCDVDYGDAFYVFGLPFMKDKEIVHDLEKQTLGFLKSDPCGDGGAAIK